MLLVFGLACATKRAQLPFRAWLPAAMIAPTPISALVHSSTFVTAGVFLFIWLGLRGLKHTVLFLRAGVTLFLISRYSLISLDLKNLVALSTLSQLRLIFIFILNGFKGLGLAHLLLHALFKRTLFIRVGVILHSLQGNQDLRELKG